MSTDKDDFDISAKEAVTLYHIILLQMQTIKMRSLLWMVLIVPVLSNKSTKKLKFGCLEGIFTGFYYLEDLNLSFNHLMDLNSMTFRGAENLRSLDLGYNHIVVINSSLLRLVELQQLSLRNNFIDHIPYDEFDSLRLHLDTLTNNLTFGFEKKCRLRELVVSHARLENPNKLNIGKLKQLSNLVLSYNEIRYINKDFLSNVYRIQEIDLSYNRIEYIQPGALKNKVHLKTLNLSHNFLTGFKYGAFRGLIRLNVLDLSYNRIVRYQKEILEEAEHLNVLILDNNGILHINYSEFSETSLSKLSIGNNFIPCKEISLLLLVDYVDVVGQNVDDYEENVNGITCGNK
ncbi:PREDICTED: leucine-rich repeat and immunoglobulin-like domain-containing nogo receptor-interacting protein 2 [Papilio polytes]|uniref:leucine-rich repeat and immunoglobulin-like domain-containing nogo receptor-interacting protein 2 n=1 Tax=Papilio polytes TaxID=76194 RepID=UPI0006760F5D|nr:PREDICTED: leucine-rich repeat and immunoglobulin-like domain-containing nogo receptor-interacting protein 2 [Papilio polytes]